MADGTRLDPTSHAAARKMSPVGITARVMYRENDKAATVRVRDRDPHMAGRVLDVSLRDARVLRMRERGVARVAVTPVTDPLGRGP